MDGTVDDSIMYVTLYFYILRRFNSKQINKNKTSQRKHKKTIDIFLKIACNWLQYLIFEKFSLTIFQS